MDFFTYFCEDIGMLWRRENGIEVGLVEAFASGQYIQSRLRRCKGQFIGGNADNRPLSTTLSASYLLTSRLLRQYHRLDVS